MELELTMMWMSTCQFMDYKTDVQCHDRILQNEVYLYLEFYIKKSEFLEMT